MLEEQVFIGCTQAMLQALDKDLRVAFVLGAICELDGPEAAYVLGISEAAFRKRLSRARAALDAFLGEQCGVASVANRCRCKYQVDHNVRLGRIDPARLDYAVSTRNTSLEVLRALGEIDATRRSLQIYRAQPSFVPTEDYGRVARADRPSSAFVVESRRGLGRSGVVLRNAYLRSGLVFSVVACSGASRPSAVPPSNTYAMTAPVEPRCTRAAAPTEPLSRAELEAASTDTATPARLLGVWDGHAFSLDGELGEPGSGAPTPGAFNVVCFGADGRFTRHEITAARAATLAPGCSPRSHTYSLRREVEAGNALMLTIQTTGGCPGDAAYDRPYSHPYHVHRLDDDFLVLIDGVTAAVSGYRRRSSK